MTKKITHLTTYTYSRDGRRCMIEHAMTAGQHSDRTHGRHLEIVERAAPKRPGRWRQGDAGGTGDGVDRRGLKSTYWCEWTRIGDSPAAEAVD